MMLIAASQRQILSCLDIHSFALLLLKCLTIASRAHCSVVLGLSSAVHMRDMAGTVWHIDDDDVWEARWSMHTLIPLILQISAICSSVL